MKNHTPPSTTKSMAWKFLFFFIIILCCVTTHVLADCECGYTYSINSTSYTFTDLLESDFLHLPDIAQNTDWRRQQYNVTAQQARGPYGESSQIAQVVSNPLADPKNYSSSGRLGGDPGLQLYVHGGIPSDGLVPVAELNSVRQDMIWGSYRAGMKLSAVPGTCAAFFWYFNDSQEIDMEFLSYQFNEEKKSFPVNLVLQSTQSVAQGYNAAGTGNYIVANLPFNPTTAYHEYRIDFIPGSVVFYADSQVLATLSTPAIPSSPGHLILTHWSNGNPLWSAGPPAQDAILTVSYVKSYFNSTLTDRIQAYQSRCTSPNTLGAVCAIPDQKSAADYGPSSKNATEGAFFFSNSPNKTNGQVVYRQGQSRNSIPTYPVICVTILLLTFLLW